ncbi:WD40 repeat domain-containing protein [Vairimorpha necatrix]|uniref:WD40 repeat domain-containing protein n=1 Tax=Vairimorpha necatrix TaxID=6039 RepID=A0AAX4JBI5_9MICR
MNNDLVEEIYSVDFSSSLFLYGGNDQKCTVYDTVSKSILLVVEGLSDSVIFSKFIRDDLLVICLIDGTVLVTNIEGSISESTEINEEISCVKMINDLLVLGTCTGSIYKISINYNTNINYNNTNRNTNVYRDENNNIITDKVFISFDIQVYMGHSSEILEIYSYNNKIYSLSDQSLLIHNIDTGFLDYKINIKEGIVFSMIPNTEIFCICTTTNILIYKSNTLINRFLIEGQPETVIYTEGYFIVGGYCDYLLIINTKMNMITYKYKIISEGINKLISDKYTIYFSTTCGYVGMCDIRQDGTVQMYESRVETIFDMTYDRETFYVGGLKGMDILKIEEYK